MNNIKAEFEEINLHGYKIHIYENKLKFYRRDNTMENYDFKPICVQLAQYLVAEAFVPKKNFRIEMVSVTPIEIPKSPETPEPEKPTDTPV